MASSRKSRKPEYHYKNKIYGFSKDKFRACFHAERKKIQCSKGINYYSGETFMKDIASTYPITFDNLKSYLHKNTWPDPDKIEVLAEALNCRPIDFLDEVPQQELEVSTMIKGYIDKDKEIVVSVYQEMVKYIHLLTRIKTVSHFSKRKEGEKPIEELQREMTEHLIDTINKDAIFTTDKIVEQLNNILREMIEFTKYSVSYLPSRWEDFSTDRMLEIGCMLCEGANEEYYSYDTEKELSASPLQKYLREMYPEADEAYFSLFYSRDNLEHLYSMELASVIRLVFLADFSEMFEEEL